jgi:hypothetical protein
MIEKGQEWKTNRHSGCNHIKSHKSGLKSRKAAVELF